MGICFQIRCHDCREYIDVDKLYWLTWMTLDKEAPNYETTCDVARGRDDDQSWECEYRRFHVCNVLAFLSDHFQHHISTEHDGYHGGGFREPGSGWTEVEELRWCK